LLHAGSIAGALFGEFSEFVFPPPGFESEFFFNVLKFKSPAVWILVYISVDCG
jgi:hypothetical protein